MCLLHYLNGNGVENDTISHQCSTAFQRDNTLYGRAGYAFRLGPIAAKQTRSRRIQMVRAQIAIVQLFQVSADGSFCLQPREKHPKGPATRCCCSGSEEQDA